MSKIFKIFFTQLFIFTTIIFSQSRQSATVNIKIKLVKSISVSIANAKISENSNPKKIKKSDYSQKNNDEKRNILVNYRVKPLQNYSLKNQKNLNNFDYLTNSPSLQLTNETSQNLIEVSQSPFAYQNLLASKKIIFKYQSIPNINNSAENLFITIVY